jgi:hypothetical protein
LPLLALVFGKFKHLGQGRLGDRLFDVADSGAAAASWPNAQLAA